ncbi:hypothetical protein [Shewanella atlantica]|uniref:hypothetical protein n=1 Tax=Shewanella atlantica TaxID=271099 RepID=UPI003735A641
MRYHLTVLLLLILGYQAAVAGEIASFEGPLKKSYKLAGSDYSEFYQTGKFADSYSMICNMGQAIQDPKRPDWYTNKPIQGLKLELRARAALINFSNQVKPMGFVVVTKNSDILINFKPLGDNVGGEWDGDVFSSWAGTETDIKVYSERFGKSGYAHFDLLDGNGFFYKSANRESPDYFLSDCKRIKKEKLPVYDWK